ncbi:hypothetical protein DQ04_00271040 [Trypanosoma grayi]|uniref:hypothetical protein n=1 Tax=Trypanosoma grayi TaxID=71804 RepID=UPI0004F4563D|nr:hypothetical protein DQ04_00271040 [Trypanosoma grayi]KEG14870.1 hypothetical protein DQ04_00271040 [Trypanosoma grayi]
MAPAPPIVYSALVKNTTHRAVTLTVTWAMPDTSDVQAQVGVASGDTVKLKQKFVRRGYTVLTGYIRRIAINGERHREATLEAPFSGVTSPVKDYRVEIHAEGGAPQLRAIGVNRSVSS